MIDNSLDGKNREAVLTEFGTRLHRTIYEHIQQYTFNSAGVYDHKTAAVLPCTSVCVCVSLLGGMLAICDMNAYRKAIKLFEVSCRFLLLAMIYMFSCYSTYRINYSTNCLRIFSHCVIYLS